MIGNPNDKAVEKRSRQQRSRKYEWRKQQARFETEFWVGGRDEKNLEVLGNHGQNQLETNHENSNGHENSNRRHRKLVHRTRTTETDQVADTNELHHGTWIDFERLRLSDTERQTTIGQSNCIIRVCVEWARCWKLSETDKTERFYGWWNLELRANCRELITVCCGRNLKS